METVDAPAPNVEEPAAEEQATHHLVDMERKNEEPGGNLVPVVLSSLPESTAATVVVAREELAERSVREQVSRNCHRRDGTMEIKGEMMKETWTISGKL
jgi:hypothetical protein